MPCAGFPHPDGAKHFEQEIFGERSSSNTVWKHSVPLVGSLDRRSLAHLVMHVMPLLLLDSCRVLSFCSCGCFRRAVSTSRQLQRPWRLRLRIACNFLSKCHTIRICTTLACAWFSRRFPRISQFADPSLITRDQEADALDTGSVGGSLGSAGPCKAKVLRDWTLRLNGIRLRP